MKILLTGATGYIGQRLLPVLLENGHHVVCCVRDRTRLEIIESTKGKMEVVEADLLQLESLNVIPEDIDAAYYLVHSMNASGDFESSEEKSATNFTNRMSQTKAQQLIYLGGIINEEELSPHLSSRKKVGEILGSGTVPLTTLRAGIIVGSGSASFEIIRDLVEKLPIMVAPKWLSTKCQPIAIRNVIEFLFGVLQDEFTYNRHFDIYGPDVLTYKQMLMRFAKARGLKRTIITVPIMTPKLSSYWLYFVTSTSYPLAKNLVDSMKVDVVAEPNKLSERLQINLMTYEEAISIAFAKIEQNLVASSWKDALAGSSFKKNLLQYIEVPEFGCFKDKKQFKVRDTQASLDRILSIGGETGWYYGDWLWGFRGWLDRLFGGVGLRRGRSNKNKVKVGESLDFWRVLYVSRKEQRLLLYAEMKLPGEAWLEFVIKDNCLKQTATFRPLGLTGRLYWYSMLPFHYFIFRGMASRISK